MSASKTSGSDPYREVTDRIVAALEQGRVPWRKPWAADVGAPRSVDGRPYSGINTILLGLAGYSDPRFGTFKAMQNHGGHVRKGERGQFVVFFKTLKVKDRSGSQTDPRTGERYRTVPMLRHFYVFNVEQVDGLDVEPIEQPTHTVDPIEAAEQVYASYPNAPGLGHGGGRAFYRPPADHVQMPVRDSFESAEAYYLTLWHELTHSTGHRSRLARDDLADSHKFGDACYSREELCAEMGSAMIAARVGVIAPDIEQSAAYIGSWLRALRNDKRLVISAASRAQRAADWILGTDAMGEAPS